MKLADYYLRFLVGSIGCPGLDQEPKMRPDHTRDQGIQGLGFRGVGDGVQLTRCVFEAPRHFVEMWYFLSNIQLDLQTCVNLHIPEYGDRESATLPSSGLKRCACIYTEVRNKIKTS
jgi:hypothetical protein